MNRLDDGQSPGSQPPQSAEDASGNGRAHDKRSAGPLPGQRVLGLKEAAVYLGCCERTVKELILDGVLPQVALTSRIQVDILDLDKLIASKKKVYTYQD
jgi:excisionase family DNA binding protein